MIRHARGGAPARMKSTERVRCAINFPARDEVSATATLQRLEHLLSTLSDPICSEFQTAVNKFGEEDTEAVWFGYITWFAPHLVDDEVEAAVARICA